MNQYFVVRKFPCQHCFCPQCANQLQRFCPICNQLLLHGKLQINNLQQFANQHDLILVEQKPQQPEIQDPVQYVQSLISDTPNPQNLKTFIQNFKVFSVFSQFMGQKYEQNIQIPQETQIQTIDGFDYSNFSQEFFKTVKHFNIQHLILNNRSLQFKSDYLQYLNNIENLELLQFSVKTDKFFLTEIPLHLTKLKMLKINQQIYSDQMWILYFMGQGIENTDNHLIPFNQANPLQIQQFLGFSLNNIYSYINKFLTPQKVNYTCVLAQQTSILDLIQQFNMSVIYAVVYTNYDFSEQQFQFKLFNSEQKQITNVYGQEMSLQTRLQGDDLRILLHFIDQVLYHCNRKKLQNKIKLSLNAGVVLPSPRFTDMQIILQLVLLERIYNTRFQNISFDMILPQKYISVLQRLDRPYKELIKCNNLSMCKIPPRTSNCLCQMIKRQDNVIPIQQLLCIDVSKLDEFNNILLKYAQIQLNPDIMQEQDVNINGFKQISNLMYQSDYNYYTSMINWQSVDAKDLQILLPLTQSDLITQQKLVNQNQFICLINNFPLANKEEVKYLQYLQFKSRYLISNQLQILEQNELQDFKPVVASDLKIVNYFQNQYNINFNFQQIYQLKPNTLDYVLNGKQNVFKNDVSAVNLLQHLNTTSQITLYNFKDEYYVLNRIISQNIYFVLYDNKYQDYVQQAFEGNLIIDNQTTGQIVQVLLQIFSNTQQKFNSKQIVSGIKQHLNTEDLYLYLQLNKTMKLNIKNYVVLKQMIDCQKLQYLHLKEVIIYQLPDMNEEQLNETKQFFKELKIEKLIFYPTCKSNFPCLIGHSDIYRVYDQNDVNLYRFYESQQNFNIKQIKIYNQNLSITSHIPQIVIQ